MPTEKFWKKSYGRDLPDLDPKLFEQPATNLFRKAIAENRDRVALVFMGVDITFAQLDLLSNRFANLLLANGFKKGDLVGINLPNIPEYVIAWLGTMKAGCVSSGVSPLLSAQEMEHQLRDSKARGLVTLDAIFAAKVAGLAGGLPDLKLIVAANVGGFLPLVKRTLGRWLGKIPTGEVRPLPGRNVLHFKDVIKAGAFKDQDPQVPLGPDDPAYIMYTGGTTGVPKGAVLTHRNKVAELMVAVKYMSWDEVKGPVISAFPMFHIAGLTFNAVSVCCGWTQLLLPDPRNTDFLCQMLEKYKPFLICNVPSMFYMLMANPKFKTIDHSNIKQAISAAAPFPADSQKELESIIGQGKLIELYGMTETTAIAVMNPLKGKKKLGTVGLPLMNTDIKLVDPQTGQEVKVGEPGEIWIRNPMVMREYYEKPDETRTTIDQDGFLHTGDVLVQDEEGYLTIVDRTKDMIIVSGFKVFSKKVEDIIAEHPAIEVIATIGVNNPERPGSELVKAFITLAPNYRFDGDEEKLKQEILEFAKARVAPYEVPKVIEFIKEMPLTSVGKLDKKALRAANK
jgi:long-chain acyl-CoA synthetase